MIIKSNIVKQPEAEKTENIDVNVIQLIGGEVERVAVGRRRSIVKILTDMGDNLTNSIIPEDPKLGDGEKIEERLKKRNENKINWLIWNTN